MNHRFIILGVLFACFVLSFSLQVVAVGVCDSIVPSCGSCTGAGCFDVNGLKYSYCRLSTSSYVGNISNNEVIYFCADNISADCGHSGLQGSMITSGTKNGLTISNCNIKYPKIPQLTGSGIKFVSNVFMDNGTDTFNVEFYNSPNMYFAENTFSNRIKLLVRQGGATFTENIHPNQSTSFFEFNGSNNVITKNNGSFNFRIEGLPNDSSNTIFSENDLTNSEIVFEDTGGNQITNNKISSAYPMEFETEGIGNTISGNTFYSTGGFMLPRFQDEFSTISSNTFDNARVTASTENTDIHHNVFINGGDLSVSGKNNTIRDNAIGGGLSFASITGVNNVVNNNYLCTFTGIDIYNNGTGNTGTGNTCATVNNWKDIGAVGACTYSCFTPVVLVHGYYGDPVGTWNTTKNFLQSKGFKVYAVDLAPGLSPANGSIKGYAKVLEGFIKDVKQAEGVNKVDIVSHSMGGLVSRWYIQGNDYKGDVRSLQMLGTPNHGTPIGYYPFLLPILGYGLLGTAGIQMLPHSWVINELNTGDPLYYSDFFPDVISPTVKYYTLTGTQGLAFPKSISSLFLPGADDGVVPSGSVPLSGVPNFSFALNHNDLHENTAALNKVYDILVSNNFPTGLPTEAAGSFSVLDSVTTTLTSGQTFTDTMQVDLNTPNMVVSLFHNGPVADFNLVSPTGKVYTPSSLDANTTYEQNVAAGIKAYTVKTPLKGTWTVKIKAGPTSGTIQPAIWTLTQNALALNVTHVPVVSPGQPVALTAKITNGIPVVTGATVLATFTSPTSAVSSLPLLDDGAHNDGSANDGVYGGTFTNTTSAGTYSVQVAASGPANGGFQRVSSTSFESGSTVDIEIVPNSITFKPSPLYVGFTTTITANVRNNGDSPATNITIKAFEGNPINDVNSIGEKTISVLPQQTVPVSFTWTPHGEMDYDITIFSSSFNDIVDANPSNDSAVKKVKVLVCKTGVPPGGMISKMCAVHK